MAHRGMAHGAVGTRLDRPTSKHARRHVVFAAPKTPRQRLAFGSTVVHRIGIECSGTGVVAVRVTVICVVSSVIVQPVCSRHTLVNV